MAKRPRKVELVFWLQDAKTKAVIGEKAVVGVTLDADQQAGAAMKLSTPDKLAAATERERIQDFAFRELVQALAITVSRSIAQTIKDWLHASPQS